MIRIVQWSLQSCGLESRMKKCRPILLEICHVARHHCQAMQKGGDGDEPIADRRGSGTCKEHAGKDPAAQPQPTANRCAGSNGLGTGHDHSYR